MKLQLEHILLIFFLLLVLYYLSNCNSVCSIDSINGFSVGCQDKRDLISISKNLNLNFNSCDCDKKTFFNNASDLSAAVKLWKKNESSTIELYGDISCWDVSNVTNMNYMFVNTSFNGDISNWDVTIVTNMEGMFDGATIFNQDISGWDVSNASNMNGMFGAAQSFNQDISGWNVSGVTDMEDMFGGATSFNQDIKCWQFHSDIKTNTNVNTSEKLYNYLGLNTANINYQDKNTITDCWAKQFESNYDGTPCEGCQPNIKKTKK